MSVSGLLSSDADSVSVVSTLVNTAGLQHIKSTKVRRAGIDRVIGRDSQMDKNEPMTILVDECHWPFRGRMWCHLVSDVSFAELHTFAKTLGKPRVAFQGDHYDLHEDDRLRAITLGAAPIDGRQLVMRLKASGLRRGPGFSRGGLAAVAQLPAPEVRTGRLLLRQWQESDRSQFRAMSADPEVMAFIGGVRSHAEADAQMDERATALALRGVGKWAVEELATGAFIGTVGLGYALFDAPFTPAIEIGWRLARPFWGRGYAVEAAFAATSYGFNTLELKEIVAFTAVGNAGSRNVMERVGMSYCDGADFDAPGRLNGDPHRRQVLYRLSQTDAQPT